MSAVPRIALGVLASLASLSAGCASANRSGAGDDDGDPVDASTGDLPTDGSSSIDATGVDAGLMTVTLSQTASNTIGASGSIACGNPDGTTAENSWYRIFRLADVNITGGLRVTAVTFGVQEAIGQPAVQVKIGTYAGAVMPPPAQLDTALISPIASATFSVPDTVSTAPMPVTVPITANVPALSQLVVEVFAPNFSGVSKYFYLGGNSLAEDRPSYLRAPACGTPQPETPAALGFPTSLVISVSGTY